MRKHVVLLGDSIFDNAAYTRGEPDVVTHLREVLGRAWECTLCAVDGSTTRDLFRQLDRVPRDATHMVVAVGGNDALGHYDLLTAPVSSSGQALALFAKRLQQFASDYGAALQRVLALRLPTTVCTIYNGNLDPREAPLARVALMTFNDVILQFAFARALDVIELRQVCSETADYANPIEPSGRGGRKIAVAIAHALSASETIHSASRVIAR